MFKNFTKIAVTGFFAVILPCNCAFCVENFEETLFEDEITLDCAPMKLNLQKDLPETFVERVKRESRGLEYQKGGVTFFSSAKKELNDYMTNDYKNTTGAVLNPNGRLSLTSGLEIKHQNPNASINSKKLYFTPNLRLRDNLSFTFANKFDNDSKTREHEFGIKYRPKVFQNADFDITTGGVWDEDTMQSKKLKFQGNLFLF